MNKESREAKAARVAPVLQEILQQLRDEIARQKLTLATISERTGIDRGNLHRTLQGQKAPSLERLMRICLAIGGSLSLKFNPKSSR